MEKRSINKQQWQSCWQEIEKLYSSADRHYHTLTHINMMAKSMERFSTNEANPEIICAMIYHDAIYDTRKKDNEERSAELAVKRLAELGLDKSIRETCSTLILCTKKHEPISPQISNELAELSEFFLDLDLLILGTDPSTYDKYSENIRKEYAWVPEAEYVMGRSLVLKSFASRPQIFFTQEIRNLYEAEARTNLGREIAFLASLGEKG